VKVRNMGQGFFERLLRAGALGGVLVVASGVLAEACGGAADPDTSLGGESHFLRSCGDGCGSDLDCISSLCTKGCIVGESSCAALAERAVCTSASIEPGSVAVCDVECGARVDCAALGGDYQCESGFCRAPTLPPGGAGPTGAGAAQCPAPGVDYCTQPSVVWTRDVSAEVRTCCQYDSRCTAPVYWPIYESEQECQSDCLCNQIDRTADGDHVAHSTVACTCAAFNCPESLQAAIGLCDTLSAAGLLRRRGCGNIEITTGGGFGSNSWVFDESSGALVGMTMRGDTTSGPCQTFAYVGGVEFTCENAEYCRLCGPPDSAYPPCE
jgi:hypothetical protein